MCRFEWCDCYESDYESDYEPDEEDYYGYYGAHGDIENDFDIQQQTNEIIARQQIDIIKNKLSGCENLVKSFLI